MFDLISAILPLEWAVVFGGFVAAVAAIWFGGRKSARADINAKAAKDYVDTRRRIDDAMDEIHGDDPAAARRFLHERGQRPGDL